jgi:DNA-binding IclR family transcriptional regulator
MVPEYKVREYLHMLDERGAVRKQRCGSRYVLTAQGRADVDMVEDIFLYDVAKHLAPELSDLQLRLVRLSRRYALKMLETHQEDLPYP